MTYQWKIVLRDTLGNEHLMAFCKDMQEAKTKMAVAEKEKSANNAIGELSMKAVNPEWIPEPTASDYTMFVQSLMSAAEWEIIRNNPNLSKFFANDQGRMREFYLLSKIVPKYYTVINFGCGNNAQSYLFTKHKRQGRKGFVCKVCGYIYEGDSLPDDFVCPLCKHGAADFEPIQ